MTIIANKWIQSIYSFHIFSLQCLSCGVIFFVKLYIALGLTSYLSYLSVCVCVCMRVCVLTYVISWNGMGDLNVTVNLHPEAKWRVVCVSASCIMDLELIFRSLSYGWTFEKIDSFLCEILGKWIHKKMNELEILFGKSIYKMK